MKNRNGFTLIEVIGAVIILGIIAIFAVVTYTSSLKGFKESYYVETERTLQQSGKEFFNNYRNYRPDVVLGAQKVLVKTLVGENYISSIKDYDGNLCDLEISYVLIVKEGRNHYSYHTCLVCSVGGYDGTSSNYCDPSWLDSNQISYTLGDLSPIYIYKGTDRNELKNKLLLSVTAVRTNYAGVEIGRIDDADSDEIPKILPSNIDIIDVDKLGEYEVTYEYNGKTSTRKVIIYENNAPEVGISYKNVIANGTVAQMAGDNPPTTTETVTYSTDKWGQKAVISLSSSNTGGTEIEKFQWYKDNRWIDLCTATNNSCTATISNDMNEEVQFRSVDKEGKISKVGSSYLIKIDSTRPACTLRKTGDENDITWQMSQNKVEFDPSLTTDQSMGVAAAISGIKTSNMIKQELENVQREEYIGYVEDGAKNFNTCSITIPRIYVVTITYNNNGGSGCTSTTVHNGDTYGELCTPTREGYTFDGWWTDASGGDEITQTTTVTAFGTQTLYAHWSLVEYTIAYSHRGGTAGVNHPTVGRYNQEVAISNLTKEMTIYFTNSSGATIDYSVSGTAHSGDTKSYTFTGWTITEMTDSLHWYGTTQATETTSSGRMEITYRNLRNEPGTVTFEAMFDPVTFKLPKISKSGYVCRWVSYKNKFLGTDGVMYELTDASPVIRGSGVDYVTSLNGPNERSFDAECYPNTNTVSFNANGGSGGQTANVTATYGSAMPSITSTKPTRTNYTFQGWYDTAASTGGTQYYTAAGASARTWNKVADTTLYARWKPNGISVTTSNKLKVGDYINYNSFITSGSYTPTEAGTGTTGNSTQTTNTSIKWRVLYITSSEVWIKPANKVNSIKFNGGTGFVNGPSTLNAMAKALYSSSTLGLNARSMTTDDVQTAMNSSSLNSYIQNYRHSDGTGEQYGTTKQYSGNQYWIASGIVSGGTNRALIPNTSVYYKTASSSNKVTAKQTVLNYNPSNYNSTAAAVLGDNTGWFATTVVYLNSNYVGFCLMEGKKNEVEAIDLIDSNGYKPQTDDPNAGGPWAMGIHPIVILPSSIYVKDGSYGTESNPWQLIGP